jgi:hypothetical protein
MAAGVAQVGEHLPSKCEALSSNISNAKINYLINKVAFLHSNNKL